MTRELNIICSACKQPIDDGAGNIWIASGELRAQEEALAAWTEKAKVNFAAAGRAPERAHWKAHHHGCDDADVIAAYSIAAERLRSWADLVSWTSQLMGKLWISSTDWAAHIGAAAEGDDGILMPVVEPELNA